jgi:5-methylcytosine-specific restriction endonuclease McrA
MDIEKFYGTEKWKRKRAAILARDKYQCQICKRYGRMRQATEVHHIVHLEDDPSRALDSSNLISLCRACHAAQHPEKAAKPWRRRYGEQNARNGEA